MNPIISMFIVGIGFGILIGVLICDLSQAQDSYYEQQNRRYDMDETNSRRQLDNHRYEEHLRSVQPLYRVPNPC